MRWRDVVLWKRTLAELTAMVEDTEQCTPPSRNAHSSSVPSASSVSSAISRFP